MTSADTSSSSNHDARPGIDYPPFWIILIIVAAALSLWFGIGYGVCQLFGG